MKKICFTIKGNQENIKGNPIPYFRTTQAGQFNKGAKRYHEWADYVRAQFIDAIAEIKTSTEKMAYKELIDFGQKKPIKESDKKQKMSMTVFFKDKSHADCDNIFKGIADALFMNDKYLISDGWDFFYTNKETGGCVTVALEL